MDLSRGDVTLMPLLFSDKLINTDTNRIGKVIMSYTQECFGYDAVKYVIQDAELRFFPSDMASESSFFQSDGVGGITGKDSITFFIRDTNNRYIEMSNFTMICHEIAHLCLIWLGFNVKVPLKHRDTSGHAPGTMLNYSTAEVHDRESEGRYATFLYTDYGLRKFRALDFKDHRVATRWG